MADWLKLNRFKKYLTVVFHHISVHGVWHLTQVHRHGFELLLWSVILIVTTAACLFCASTFWIRYFTSPTVIALARNYYDWNTTFPSLTFCRHEKLNRTAMELFINEYKPDNASKLEEFLENLVDFNVGNFEDLAYDGISVDKYKEIAFNLSNNFDYNVTANNLTYYLQKTMNDLGVCFSFNSEISKYFTYEYLLNDKLPEQNVTHIVNYFDKDLGAVVRGMADGCDIYIHNPYEVPRPTAVIKTERQRQSYTSLTFKPIIIESDNTVKQLFINQRKCRFPDESNLRHFPDMYTHSLCRLECRIKLYLKYCSCIPFYMKLYAFLPTQGSKCDCLQNCNDMNYALQSKNVIFWFRGNFIRWELAKSRIRYKREVIYSFSDALVASGSSAGLYLGITFISILEIIFFACIHPCFKHRNRPRN